VLKEPAARLLRLMAPELDQLGNDLILEGHTDAVPFGTPAYSNWDLSTDRAHAARRALETSGLRPAKILEVRGYADRSLRVPDDPYDPRNRRVSMLLPFRDFVINPAVEAGDRRQQAGIPNPSFEALE
jgi:chemotaxis protein MotB